MGARSVVTLGIVLGVVFGTVNIIVSARLADVVANYPASGFDSFRVYVNYVCLTGAPFKILVASAIGGLSGLVGGIVAAVARMPGPAHG